MSAPAPAAGGAEIFDAAFLADPQPHFARLRARGALARIGATGAHWVLRFAAVEEALAREEDFSAHLSGVLVRGDGGAPELFAIPATGANQVIATADEPEHGVHRALAQPRLAAPHIAALEAPLRAWVDEALSPWLEAGGGDFVPLAETVPARAVARVLGLPDGDVARFRTWAMMGGAMLAGDVDAAGLAALGAETGRMVDYLGRQLAAARVAPEAGDGAPMLHALARGVAEGAIEESAAVGIAVVMFGAGGESTAALLASCVWRLALAPELADALREDPALVPRFVEEVARLESPFRFHYRVVRRTCTLAGTGLVPGDRLLLCWAAANRDPERFEEPDALRLDRRHPKDHLGFGRGAHFCIGAPLARLEARLMLEALLARTRRLALGEAAPPLWARSLFVRRLERLVVVAS